MSLGAWRQMLGLEEKKPIDKKHLADVARRGFEQAEKLGIEIPEHLMSRLEA